MQIDGYSNCPCGSGKKIKFCCCKDMLRDLEKVIRSISGEQYVATQSLLAHLIADRGPRAALLAVLAETHLVQQQFSEARQVAGRLLETMPHSGSARVVLAICDSVEGRADDAVEHLQQALELAGAEEVPNIPHAIRAVAEALLRDGRIAAARAHHFLLARLVNPPPQEVAESLEELNHAPEMPVVLKQDFRLSDCPENVRWKGEFEAAMKSAARGAWLAACENLQALDQKVPDQLAVVRNIAILHTWLGHSDAIAAWRHYESLPTVVEEDAVDAEALCQLLKMPSEQEMSDVTRLTYQIRDVDRLMEVLLSDNRCDAPQVDPRTMVEEGEPPPKGFFQLLDRPSPAASDSLTVDDLPLEIAIMMLFGKQTDREARLEVGISNPSHLEKAQAQLSQIAGEWLEPAPRSEVVNQVPTRQLVMRLPYWFPRELSMARAVELQKQIRERTFCSAWVDYQQQAFDGKSPRQAIAEPHLRIRVLAAILNFELANENVPRKQAFDFNGLRRQLGLPERGSLDVHDQPLGSVPMSRWSRVDFSTLNDDELLAAFSLLLYKNLRLPVCRCVQTIISRPSLADKIDLARLYQLTATMTNDMDEALEHIHAGRQIAEKEGASPAQWYLLELQVRLARFEAEESNRLAKLLATQYANEPGVREGLYAVLTRAGVMPPGPPNGRQPPPEMAPVPGETSEEQPSPLWTPDSAGAKKEAKLWLPGAE